MISIYLCFYWFTHLNSFLKSYSNQTQLWCCVEVYLGFWCRAQDWQCVLVFHTGVTSRGTSRVTSRLLELWEAGSWWPTTSTSHISEVGDQEELCLNSNSFELSKHRNINEYISGVETIVTEMEKEKTKVFGLLFSSYLIR